MATERTPLTNISEESNPSYIFSGRTRQRQIRKLQCCICSAFVCVLVMALVITVGYSVYEDNEENSTDNATTETLPVDINLIFLQMKWPINDEPHMKWNLPEPTEIEKNNAISAGKKSLGDKEILEENTSSPAVNTPSFKHQKSIAKTKEADHIMKIGFVENSATHDYAKLKNFGRKNQRFSIGHGPKIDLRTDEPSNCDFNSKYRTANGSCNNKINPDTFGVAMRPFRRMLSPDYADGIYKPRESYSGVELPSARQVSYNVHRPSFENDVSFTVMLAVWGQFLDHDITATAGNHNSNGDPIECCDSTKSLHPECYPVKLTTDDPYLQQENLTCMNFVRSAPAATGMFGPRQQLNQATSFIDGSVIYGSSDEVTKSLRTLENGLLRMYVTPDNRTLLPVDRTPSDGCNEEKMNAKGKYCFISGDSRANENLHLTSMHLIWSRHHNYIARNLHELNPHWDDETIFQESRRILGGQMQHIHYNEFLPILLGDAFTSNMSLISQPEVDDFSLYDNTVDASVANGFAAAAFRFAHTILPGLMKLTKNTSSPEAVELHKLLFNPYSLYNNNGLDNAINSAINTPIAKSDPFFSKEVTDKLFQSPIPETPRKHGLDLVSLNIQRGRDHGLPAYPEWRKHCNLPPTNTWKQMRSAVDPVSYTNLMKLYKSPHDIDFYTGALSEPTRGGAILGPLLTCVIADQFYRTKMGDSFWYELVGPMRNTREQLNQIYNTTLSSIICRNSDNVTKTSKFLMKRTDSTNVEVECNTLDTFDFTPWKEDMGKVTENFEVVTNNIENADSNDLHSIKLDSPQSNIVGIANTGGMENHTILV